MTESEVRLLTERRHRWPTSKAALGDEVGRSSIAAQQSAESFVDDRVAVPRRARHGFLCLAGPNLVVLAPTDQEALRNALSDEERPAHSGRGRSRPHAFT